MYNTLRFRISSKHWCWHGEILCLLCLFSCCPNRWCGLNCIFLISRVMLQLIDYCVLHVIIMWKEAVPSLTSHNIIFKRKGGPHPWQWIVGEPEIQRNQSHQNYNIIIIIVQWQCVHPHPCRLCNNSIEFHKTIHYRQTPFLSKVRVFAYETEQHHRR